MQKGELHLGKTINLAALARQLDVSVTPIREALTQLQQSQIIKAIPNRGFIISGLSTQEAKNIYELVANMEALALEESEFDAGSIEQLKKQQELFLNTNNPLEQVNADMEFHRLLTCNYANDIAQQIILDLKTRIFFYEKELAMNTEFYKNAHNQHDSIINAIQDDNRPTAALILKMNWLQSLGYMQKLMVPATA
ncbi:DNA-binding GntR family transcriptional regulator [Saonia flava]|uniref:DNA-binding GntR family transcriptional regulator n=2 Tax=Saonia flava TaxID=523696 RepID=A0A846QXP1_9FLAO|nr:DNA-binding GntR family transcriptional regulator [Saonia flava]